jgi:hypothetical protein
MEKVFTVSVTQLKISKPFLKVFLRNLGNKDTKSLKKLEHLFEQSEPSDIQVGEIYIARVGASQYERSRVVQVSKVTQNASVIFIDSGFVGRIKVNQVRRCNQALSKLLSFQQKNSENSLKRECKMSSRTLIFIHFLVPAAKTPCRPVLAFAEVAVPRVRSRRNHAH